MDNFILKGVLSGLTIFTFSFASGLIVADIKIKQKLNECARQNNVYECVLIALPKKETEKFYEENKGNAWIPVPIIDEEEA